MTAATLMIQGTSSSAGKSLTVAALCRIFSQDGYRVAPFKSQNMALNSFVTSEGGEIGRAQAVQAEAAGIQPSVHMNPVLLKPQSDATSQVIVLGRAAGTSGAADYYRSNGRLLRVIRRSLSGLRGMYDAVIIEGAGSPAEVNLMDKEIANMRIARLADAPVLLVGDIDRGGVFASLVGTMELLRPWQRRHIRGFIINKFRGDIALLRPGLDFLEKRCGLPVLGVIPYVGGLKVAQEDSVFLDERSNRCTGRGLDIAVIRLPHIANYDDFDPLAENASLRYVSHCSELGEPDLIVLPGTKGSIPDMRFLNNSGLGSLIQARAEQGVPVIGVCGGFQMLGRIIRDPDRTESDATEEPGLGLLDTETVFRKSKVTRQVAGTVEADRGLLQGMRGIRVQGYEIHMGRSIGKGCPLLNIEKATGRSRPYPDGAVNGRGSVFGTYMHGIFHNGEFTGRLLDNIARLRGRQQAGYKHIDREKAYDELAAVFRQGLDMQRIYQITFGGTHG